METDDLLLSIRTSSVFRNSVYFIDVVFLIALATTALAISQLHSKKLFNTSTNYLLIFDFIVINIHNFSYVYLQNWSLYRSIFWSNSVEDVMFRSEECWPHHVANEYTKTVTLFLQFALIINRISVTINAEKYSKAKYAAFLSAMTLAASGVFTITEHWRGPLAGMRTTSCFRESDVIIELYTEHIIPYILICSVSILCSLLLIAYVKIRQKKKTYDVATQYMRKESMISTIAVAIIGLFQLATFSFYDFLLTVVSYFAEQNPGEQDTNIIGWLYTGPFNAVISPSAVLFYVFWIKRSRKCEIKTLMKHESRQTDHFQQLGVYWNKV